MLDSDFAKNDRKNNFLLLNPGPVDGQRDQLLHPLAMDDLKLSEAAEAKNASTHPNIDVIDCEFCCTRGSLEHTSSISLEWFAENQQNFVSSSLQLTLYAFDVLMLDSRILTKKPFTERYSVGMTVLLCSFRQLTRLSEVALRTPRQETDSLESDAVSIPQGRTNPLRS